MPGDFADGFGNEARKSNDHLAIGPRLGNQMPRVSQVTLQREAARDAIRVVEKFDLEHAPQVEGPGSAMNRGSPDAVPTVTAKQQAIGAYFCLDKLVFGEAFVADTYGAALSDGVDQLLIDRGMGIERRGRRKSQLDGAGDVLEIVAKTRRHAAFKLKCRAAGSGTERDLPNW